MKLIEVNDEKTWRWFLKLPFRLYKNDPVWVPPLLSELKKQLDKKKNPFFQHCTFRAWLLEENNEPLGRVLAFVDTLYNNFQRSETGFIGFLESVNRQEVADRLFEVSGTWLKQAGVNKICGPMNLSIGNECGVQVNGFEYPPLIQMNYTPAYYRALFENAGFSKEHDLYAYKMTDSEVQRRAPLLARLEELIKNSVQKYGVTFRTIDLRNYKKELGHIRQLYNETMKQNWGFAPAGFEEMLYTGNSLKQIVDKDLVYFAEVNGEVASCSVSVPDINQALIHLRNGKLFPVGFIKLLYYLKKVDSFRLLFLGVRPEYRLKGLDAFFYYHTMRKAVAKGYRMAELSWISEENKNLISIVEKIGAERYKTYRVYQKQL